MVKTMTKKSMVEFLKDSQVVLKGKKKLKSLADRVSYTLKKLAEDANQVSKEVLVQLIEDIKESTGATPAPVENSVKTEVSPSSDAPKKVLKAKKSKEEPVEKVTDEATEEEEVAEEKTTKKLKATKKEEPKKIEKPKVTAKEVKTEKQIVLADHFPQEFKADGIGKLKVLTNEVKDIKDLYNLVQAGKNIVFALYWSERHLKQFEYDLYQINGKKKFKNFPHDLDLAQLIYVSEEHKIAYVVSAYSEVLYSILPSDIEMTDGMRFTSGLEYNIYEVVE